MGGLPHGNRDNPGGWLWCGGRRGAARMVPRHRVVDASLLMSAVSRKEPLDGRLTHGPGVRFMSTDTSVPQPRVSGLDVSDSALLATLLREAPIGFAFFGPDLRFRRINQTLARLDGLDLEAHLGLLPSEVWPGTLASRVESAVRHVLAEGQPLYESNQPVGPADAAAGPGRPAPARPAAPGRAAVDKPVAGPASRAGRARDDRHWAFSWFPSHDPEGNIAGVALIAVDVTDRQNSAEAVRRSEERYRSLVQAGAQVVWVTTPTGQIAEDSPEWRWITGQS